MTQRPFDSEHDIYDHITKVPERRLDNIYDPTESNLNKLKHFFHLSLDNIYDPTERTLRIPLGMSGLYMEWTDTGMVVRNEQPQEKQPLDRELVASFYGDLGKVHSDRYVDPVVKVGSIETARRFPGSENFYNGKPGIILGVKHGWERFVFSLIGHAHAGRFLDECKVDTEKDLVGKVVEILGKGGKEVRPEFGESFRPLVQAYGIRPAKRFM